MSQPHWSHQNSIYSESCQAFRKQHKMLQGTRGKNLISNEPVEREALRLCVRWCAPSWGHSIHVHIQRTEDNSSSALS